MEMNGERGAKTADLSSDDLVGGASGKITARAARLPLALCFLFLLSGSSGLIYEVVWLRMLSRTLGSTVYATSTILAVFMAGLALGSLVLGRLADKVRRPLVLYAILEASIGATALLSLSMNSWLAPLYRAIYATTGDSRVALTVGQVLLTMIVLLIPTSLMGATLPTLCAYGVRRCGSMGGVIGTLYALNTLGALLGVLAGGFVLIGAIGETRTMLVGITINAIVAAVALALFPAIGAGASCDSPAGAAPPARSSRIPISRQARRSVLVCVCLSGFVSLALEIVWSRMLALYLGTSIYAFSGMLAVMLLGIGFGGWYGRKADVWKDPLLALARLELGVAFFAAVGLATFSWGNYSLFLRPLIVVGPAALLLGMAFPVAVRCYADYANSTGRRVGELYAWNTAGCILGALAGGFLLVPRFGAASSGAILSGLAAVASLVIFAAHPRGLGIVRLADALVVVAVGFVISRIGDPYSAVIRNNILPLEPGCQIFDQREEAAATTTAAGVPDVPTARHLLVNGVGVTILVTGNKLIAHLPLWLADSPRDALVVCMGMGTTFRSMSRHPDIDVTVVELVPAVPRFMHYFHTDADRVMSQPNSHVVVDDGRNYLLMHPRLFDVITIDPAPPLCSAGTVNLYSEEFCKLCAGHLRPGGMVCLWVPVAQESEVKMILRTFATVFPFVSVWSGPTYQGFILLGTLKPVNDVEARVRRGFTDPAAVSDLNEWDNSCDTPAKVLALRVCDRNALLAFTSNRPAITDDRPFTEFPLWRYLLNDPEYFHLIDTTDLRKWIASR